MILKSLMFLLKVIAFTAAGYGIILACLALLTGLISNNDICLILASLLCFLALGSYFDTSALYIAVPLSLYLIYALTPAATVAGIIAVYLGIKKKVFAPQRR